MSEKLQPFLSKLSRGEDLSRVDAEVAFEIIMSGEAHEAQIGAFLMGLRLKGETIDEITGAVSIMRSKANKVVAPKDAIDIVGTGGDKSGTYNISTAAALVTAGCGITVAKHGNKALSSKTGTADVLSELGVNLDAEIKVVERCINEAGIGFMMAPKHHSAMRFVGPARVALGVPTIFNILGPLSNPAGVRRQATGVFDQRWVEPMAQTLQNLGSEAAWVFHGSDGLDELTTTGPSFVAELKDGKVSTFNISPSDYGIPLSSPEALIGGDSRANAGALMGLLKGQTGPYRDIVILNAASALYISSQVDNLAEGIQRAQKSIDEGKAQLALNKLIKISNANL